MAGETKTIEIHVRGGLIQDINNIPPGIVIKVIDFDVHDKEGPGIETINGELAFVAEWD